MKTKYEADSKDWGEFWQDVDTESEWLEKHGEDIAGLDEYDNWTAEREYLDRPGMISATDAYICALVKQEGWDPKQGALLALKMLARLEGKDDTKIKVAKRGDYYTVYYTDVFAEPQEPKKEEDTGARHTLLEKLTLTLQNGKGDTPRPISDRDQYDKNWEAVFGGRKKHTCSQFVEVDGRERCYHCNEPRR